MAYPMTHGVSAPSPLSHTRGAGELGRGTKAQGAEEGPSFAETLKGYLRDVGELEKAAEAQVKGLAEGTITDVHQVMLAVEEANLALDLLIQIRNRLLDAYKELTSTAM